MSGGVDSSVAAALLVKKGFRVVGGFIKNWSDSKDVWSGECAWRGDRRDAIRVAAKLGIPLLTFDFEDQYRKQVVTPLFDGYARGVTPNPDVLCNQFIKFGLFYHEMKRLKLNFVATGHYAQVKHDRKGVAHLLRGRDSEKDQSYFLHRVDQMALRHALFPVGDKKKADVRRIAHSLGLPTAEKEESMGICFIGKQNMTAFLRTRIQSKPGDVVDPNGRVIGRHKGLDSVTIGQRHGFSVSQPVPSNEARGPWYAAIKDPSANCLMVVPGREHPALYATTATIGDVRWVAGAAPAGKRGLTAMVRYRQDAVPVSVHETGRGRIRLDFKKSVFAVAPGQSAVIYKGEECLGGGIILE
ncbi:MAG TPA: tRNA 2-thiouridine(34) synthase MnmA [Candidatus Methylomirabilis sp.]|nr:tRNA 2-thiouridine(34) synthase MnmA [Candidatus Methylomirabilis sp.]